MSIDVSSLDSLGDRLRCPSCGKYVPGLSVLDGGELRCHRCETEAGERADAEVSDWVRPGTRAKRVATPVEAADGAG